MKKKILSLALTTALVSTMLAGCGSSGDNTAKDSSTQAATTETTQEAGSAATEAEGEPYTVAIQLVNISTDLTDVEKVEEAINAITEPAINCKVDIQNLFIGDLPTTTSMNIVSGEKMDIVAVGLTQKLSDISDDGILMPLDSYLLYAPTYTELVKDYTVAGQIDGVQYALPVNPYIASGLGFVYNKDMADQYGIEIKEGATFKDFTEVFKKLKENGVYGTSLGQATNLNMQFWYPVELFGTNGDYGMITDPINSTKIENVYASDYFKEYADTMKLWADAGYIPADSLTDSTTVQEYLTAGKIFGTYTNYDMSQYASWGSGQPFNIDIVQTQDPIISTSFVTERMWGLASNSENPQKAMEFLNYMYENPAVANLLQYGIEGENYKIVDGTKIVTTAEGATTGTKGYTSMFTKFGNPLETLTAAPNTDSYPEEVKAYNENVPKSLTLGYTFDVTDFSAEAGAVSNVIAEYLPRLQTGQVESVDSYLTEFLDALDKAGYNDIIAGNQAQLDSYLAK